MSVLGIDIGTSYCVLATIQGGAITVVRNDLSDRTTPTLVGFTWHERLIGDAAVNRIWSNYANTCRNFKQLLGVTCTEEELIAFERQFQLAKIDFVDESEAGLTGYRVKYKGESQVFSATRALAALFTKLKTTAERAIGGPVKDVVIGVPGWASDSARQAVLDAAEIADLNCLRLMNDHAAVALDYGMYRSLTFLPEEASRVAFFGVDISVVDFYRGRGVLLAASSNRFLGGRNINLLLMEHFAKQYTEKYRMGNPLDDPKARLKLEDAANIAKKVLSANREAAVNVEYLQEPYDFSCILTRVELEELCLPLREALLKQLAATFADNGLSPNDVHHIEVYGNSSRSPWIREAISSFFEGRLPLSMTLSMDETIARGCALLASKLVSRYRVREFEFVDKISEPVTVSYPVSAETGEEMKTTVIFEKGASYGCKKFLTFDRDTSFNVQLMSGSTGAPLHSRIVVPSTDLPGSRRIKVSVKICLDGRVSWDTAQLLLDEVVEELVKEKRPIDEPAPAAAGEQPVAAEQQFEEVQVLKKKTKTKRLDCKIENQAHRVGYLTPEVKEVGLSLLHNYCVQMYKSAELTMIKADLEQQKLREIINDVDAYLIQRTSTFESYRSYNGLPQTEEVKEQIEKANKALSDVQQWMYNTYDGTKEDYMAKLEELKAVCSTVEELDHEIRERDQKTGSLNSVLTGVRISMAKPDWHHIDPEKMKLLENKVAEVQKWVEQVVAMDKMHPRLMDPTVTTAQIVQEREALEGFSKTILVDAEQPGNIADVNVDSSTVETTSATPPTDDAKM